MMTLPKGVEVKKLHDLEVYQANSFVESRQEYTVNEKRLLSTIISFVKPTDEKFISYELSIKDWAKMLNVSPEAIYQIADDVTTALMQKIVAVKDPKGRKFKKWHVLETAEYEDGTLKLELHKNMNDIFLQLKNSKKFTHYELMEFVTLTSTHAQRIYELLKQYQHSKQRRRTIPIEELKMMLGIENKYPQYKFFKRDVLDVAHRQITKNTTLRYEWKPIKKGRKYNEIEFFEIHIAGKENPNEIQELAFLETYLGEECHHAEFNTYLTIKRIERNKDGSLDVQDKFDDNWYAYTNITELQNAIAKAKVQRSLL